MIDKSRKSEVRRKKYESKLDPRVISGTIYKRSSIVTSERHEQLLQKVSSNWPPKNTIGCSASNEGWKKSELHVG